MDLLLYHTPDLLQMVNRSPRAPVEATGKTYIHLFFAENQQTLRFTPGMHDFIRIGPKLFSRTLTFWKDFPQICD